MIVEYLLKYRLLFIFSFCNCFSMFSQNSFGNKMNTEQDYEIFAGEYLTEYRLSLLPGSYDIKMKVWLKEDSSLRGIKSVIMTDEPKELVWNLVDVEKGSWIELNQKFYLNTTVLDAVFKIEMVKDFLGYGEGEIYIDDILIHRNQDYLVNDNFTLQTIGETCSGKNNGKIVIEAISRQDYTVSINGTETEFTEGVSLEGLSPGTYDVCISIKAEDYVQCYSLFLPEGKKLVSNINFDKNMSLIEISEGSPPYTISINDEVILTTNEKDIEINSKRGDEIKVSSSISCEGVITQKVQGAVLSYPNPTHGKMNIYVPTAQEEVVVNLYDSFGKKVWSTTSIIKNGRILIDVGELRSGVYTGVLELDNPERFRVVKK